MSTAPEMMISPTPFTTDKTASKLLSPKRRKQIEVWLEETILYEAHQTCASDKRHGHSSDVQSSPPQHSDQSRSSLTSSICAVCGRYIQGEEPVIEAVVASKEPPAPRAEQHSSKSVFRGLTSAMIPFRSKPSGDKYDPALSTKMFLASTADNDDSSGKSSSHVRLGSSENNENGIQGLDEKMARLKRAQKLLERSQPKQAKD